MFISKFLQISLVLYMGLALSACSEEIGSVSETESQGAVDNTQPTSHVSQGSFSTAITIREVMNALIDVNADILWEAVRFENTLEFGSQEFRPESDEEWSSLRLSAIGVIEGANALMIPGRQVAPEGSTTPHPEFERNPDEVDEMLRRDFESWIIFSKELQEAALMTIEAIDQRDIDLFMLGGDRLDRACESCHAQYWYRP